MTSHDRFKEWFRKATGHEPYPFQVRFACGPAFFQLPSPSGRGEGEGDFTGEGL